MARLYLWLLVLVPLSAFASSVRVSLSDPAGLAVTDAVVTITGAGDETRRLANAAGAFIADLPAGEYVLRIEKNGFEPVERSFTVTSTGPVDIAVVLKLAPQSAEIDADTQASRLANSDPNYRALRTAKVSGAWRVENFSLKHDVGVLTFKSGTFSFAPPVLGHTVMAVFTGEGSFHLAPVLVMESRYLEFVTGQPEIEEPFHSVVLCFTDSTEQAIKAHAKPVDEAPQGEAAFEEFRSRVRHRGDQPRSMVEYLFGMEQIPNVDADLLAELYAPERQSFTAYIHGLKHPDLRFIVSNSGALPMLPSPEEVAVVNRDPAGTQDGIWYLSHMSTEFEHHTARSTENRRWVHAESYRIETAIGKNDHLGAVCAIKLKVLINGTRIVKFGLLPALRVTSVRFEGKEIPYIQESRKADGSFYAEFPTGMKAGDEAELTIEYEGDKVVHNAGSGIFSVSARSSWYPTVNSFNDRCPYDLTFRVPRRYTLVSVGKLEKAFRDGDEEVTHWVASTPIAVAGFNYGDFKKLEKRDDETAYSLESYATQNVPDYLHDAAQAMNLTPSAMAQGALVDAQNSIRIFRDWFGDIPYGRIAITQQPEFSFGQSWPCLVYLPVSAFLDSTQRWALLGKNAYRFGEFVDEVTPHEVSHQWWGHAVGWATYRDQWLSEGFADFSAGIFLQITAGVDKYLQYWQRQQRTLVEKNNWGMRPAEVAPLWMGIRLDTFRSERAYNQVVYSKGAFTLHMLQSLMWDRKTGDKDFKDMMHDFTATYFNKDASTEDFKAIAEKHMKPSEDVTSSHNLDWFFSQWVYGTALPRYRFQYSIRPLDGGAVELDGKMTQSDVGPDFYAAVPVYLDFDKGWIRMGSVALTGSSTSQEFKIKLPKKPKRVAANVFRDVLSSETVSEETKQL